ncbi:MAG: polysaccharide deacetylase family protein [Promicromonosporaceae bacterium]|nr:polysaccharide deacetylase family protein [Promicromonosporaceae bacterium]
MMRKLAGSVIAVAITLVSIGGGGDIDGQGRDQDQSQPALALPVPPASPSSPVLGALSQNIVAARDALDEPLVLLVGDEQMYTKLSDHVDVLPLGSPPPTAAELSAVAAARIVDEAVSHFNRDSYPHHLCAGEVLVPGIYGVSIDQDAARRAVETELLTRLTKNDARPVRLPAEVQAPPTHPALPGRYDSRTSVWLTFDDGPGAYTEQILDILAEHQVEATFYVTGENARRYPETIQRILDDGHQLGNHSLTHPFLPRLSRERIYRELQETQDIIYEITGYRPTSFRPPYGAVNATVCEVVAEMDMTLSLWTVDPEDWRRNHSASYIRTHVVNLSRPGSTVLLHVLSNRTVSALPGIITGLRARDLELSTATR